MIQKGDLSVHRNLQGLNNNLEDMEDRSLEIERLLEKLSVLIRQEHDEVRREYVEIRRELDEVRREVAAIASRPPVAADPPVAHRQSVAVEVPVAPKVTPAAKVPPAVERSFMIEPDRAEMAGQTVPAWKKDMPGPKVDTVQEAMSINDRMLFVRELFEGDEEQFALTMDRINETRTFREVLNDMKAAFPEWDEDSEDVYRFYMMVRRKFREE